MIYELLHMNTLVLTDQQKLHQLCVDTGCSREDLSCDDL